MAAWASVTQSSLHQWTSSSCLTLVATWLLHCCETKARHFFTENRLIHIGHSAQVFSDDSANRWEVTPPKAWISISVHVQIKIWVPFRKQVLIKDTWLSSVVAPRPQLMVSDTQVRPVWGQKEEENSDCYEQLSASLKNRISSCPWRDIYKFKPLG